MRSNLEHAGQTPRVSVQSSRPLGYPRKAPFHPPKPYPELVGSSIQTRLDPDNLVYEAVRESLRLLGLDATNFGTSDWNPLRGLVNPGDRVLVKPNWVAQGHHLDGSWEQIITHGAVIRPVLDYVALALKGRGTISVADGPMLSSDFEQIVTQSGVREIQHFYQRSVEGVRIEVLDLRSTFLETKDDVIVRRHQLPGDPKGATAANLGSKSEFFGFRGEGRYYGADYDTGEVNRHHAGKLQEYLLSGTAMDAQAIIDVPKLKTHQKVGVTLALKGVVGLNCGRNWLPHRTQGTPDEGGDQFSESGLRQRAEFALVGGLERASLRFPRTVPSLYRVAKRIGRHVFGATNQTVRGGGWYGNDTLWRMALDINRALLYADANGELHGTPTKARFCVVDGIVAGEGTGPIYADPKPCGLIVAGTNALAVDIVCAEMMGFDHRRIPMLARATSNHTLPLMDCAVDQIVVESNVEVLRGGLSAVREAGLFKFNAPLGWAGHIERRVC